MTPAPPESRYFRLHHVGFVVADIATAMPGFVRAFPGAVWDQRIIGDSLQNVRVAFLSLRAGDSQIELVEPAGENTPVSRFLRVAGGGLHHVCYEVDDLDAQLTAMHSRGAAIAKRPKPAAAFEGRRIAWVLTSERLLVELLEKVGTNPG